jgi:hypothetical protein
VIIHPSEQIAPFLRFVLEFRPIQPEPSVFLDHGLSPAWGFLTDHNMLAALDQFLTVVVSVE